MDVTPRPLADGGRRATVADPCVSSRQTAVRLCQLSSSAAAAVRPGRAVRRCRFNGTRPSTGPSTADIVPSSSSSSSVRLRHRHALARRRITFYRNRCWNTRSTKTRPGGPRPPGRGGPRPPGRVLVDPRVLSTGSFLIHHEALIGGPGQPMKSRENRFQAPANQEPCFSFGTSTEGVVKGRPASGMAPQTTESFRFCFTLFFNEFRRGVTAPPINRTSRRHRSATTVPHGSDR